MATQKSFLKKLQSFFSITPSKNKNNSSQQIYVPAEKTADDDKKTTRLSRVQFPSYIEKLYKWWLSETHDTSESLRHRLDRYEDLEYMYYNDTVISMAADLYADEATQADEQSEIIGVESPSKEVRKEILSLLKKWGYTQSRIHDIAHNLALLGDSFVVNSISASAGVTDTTSIDVKTLKDRIEFNAILAEEKMRERGFIALTNSDSRLKKLAQALELSKEDYSSYFKSYLFGYQLGENIYLPPWNVSHFRLFSSKSEFFPYGRSLFINAIAPFRQLQASKNMMALARAAKFPKEHFEIETSEGMTEVEKWEAVNEARQEYQNLGIASQEKEEFAVGGQIWTPEGLLKYNLIENRMSLDDIADIELLRDDMIIATRVPKGYLIVDRASFGTSGQALLQQFKPFGRAVYTIQSAILYEITQLIKIHFLITDQFEKEFTNFQLSMNFPVIEESSDRLRMKNDTLRLANDIISNIQNSLGTRDGLPPDVVKAIFSKISFLEPEDVEQWINTSAEALLGENFNIRSVNHTLSESETAKIKSRLNETIIKEAYFEALKKNSIIEGVFAKKHFVNSTHSTPDQKQMFYLLRTPNNEPIKG